MGTYRRIQRFGSHCKKNGPREWGEREVDDGLRGHEGVERVRSCWGVKGRKSTEDLKGGELDLNTCSGMGRKT